MKIKTYPIILIMVIAFSLLLSSCTPTQGLTGSKGDRGEQGLQGELGLQGIKGDKGDIGATGVKGDTGAQGIQGIVGLQGIKGDKGDAGIQGVQGIQGLQGLKGDKGDTGTQGTSGIIWGLPISSTYNFSYLWGTGVGRGLNLSSGDRVEFTVSANLPAKVYVCDNYQNKILDCVTNTNGLDSHSAGSFIATSNGIYVISMDWNPTFSHNGETVTGLLTYTVYPNLNK